MPAPLPTIRGRDLDGRPRQVPDDLDGAAFLLIAHRQGQQGQVDAWMTALASTDLPMLELPVMGRRWAPAARFIEGGMASNLPPDVRRRTICVYAHVDAWRAERGLPPQREVTVLLVDADGLVRHVAVGPPDPRAVAEANAAATALTDPPTD